MNYYLDLFKTPLVSTAPLFDSIIDTIIGGNGSCPEGLLHFPIASVQEEIEQILSTRLGVHEHIVHIQNFCCDSHDTGWIQIGVPLDAAKGAIEALFPLAIKHDLVLFDRQNNRPVWRKMELYNECFIKILQRSATIVQQLSQHQEGIFSIRKVAARHNSPWQSIGYAITLREIADTPLEERLHTFNDALLALLEEGERLEYEYDYFIVKGHPYFITFVLEAYGERADRLVFFEQSRPKIQSFSRNSVEYTFREVFPHLFQRQIDHIWERANVYGFIDDYPNPAERLVASCDKEKELSELGMNISYRSPKGSDYDFKFYPISGYDDDDESTTPCLHMDHEVMSFLVPMIKDIFPYFTRFHDEVNILHCTMCADILERIRYVANLVMHDTNNEELNRYLDSFCYLDIFLASRLDDNGDFIWRYSGAPREVKRAFLYTHRERLYRFYCFFSDWLDDQICSNNEGFIKVLM